jgi:hypothetical protein
MSFEQFEPEGQSLGELQTRGEPGAVTAVEQKNVPVEPPS